MNFSLLALCLGATALYSNYDGTAIHKTGPQTMAGPLTITGDPSLDVRGKVQNAGAAYGGAIPIDDAVRWASTLQALLESSTSPTAGTDTGFTLNTVSSLAATDKILSVTNSTAEVCRIDGAGGIWTANGKVTSGIPATGGVETAFILDSDNSLSAVNDTTLSVRNAGTELLKLTPEGNITTKTGQHYSYVTATGGTDRAFAFTPSAVFSGADRIFVVQINGANDGFWFDGAGTLGHYSTYSMVGNQADGATAVAAKIASGSTYSNATAKLLSVVNNSTEKVYVNKDGLVYSAVGTLLSGVANGASAVGWSLKTVAYSTDGAKLASLVNNTTEKAYISYEGGVRPGTTIAAAPAQKYACTTSHEGELIYSRDSDIGAGNYGGMCVCACDGDGTPTCGWLKINGGANCY